jgi:DNA-directed RNA polymerase specialized sigma subunit
MQNYNMENYSERFQIYQARLQNSNFEAKKKYNISSCISIWICNFESDELADCFLNYITLKDKFNRRRDKFKYEVQEINLKYLDQCPKIELKEAFQYFILPYDEAIELEPKCEFAKEMKNLMFKYNLDEEAKKIDEWRALNAIALENTLKEEAEEAKLRNIKLEEESKQLKEESNQLKENTKNMILLMHKNNISLEDIAESSNLSVEEVKKIINE